MTIGEAYTTTLVATFGQDGLQDVMSFEIQIEDPCPSTTFNGSEICPDLVTYVNGGTVTVELDLNLWTDVASTARGTNDGYSLCGTRTLAISPDLGLFSLSSNSLTVESVDPNDAG